MHLSFKVRRFLPAVLSVALLLSTANAGIGYAENSAAAREEVSKITAGYLPHEYQLKITRGSENYTIELYCMNHDLNWPLVDMSYSVGYINLDSDENKELKEQLIRALYAGYPYNGMGLYSENDNELDIDTYNSYLQIPKAFLDDPELGKIFDGVTYTYDDYKLTKEDPKIKKLSELTSIATRNGGNYITSGGLTSADITNTVFYTATRNLLQAVDYANEQYTPIFFWNLNNGWKDVAHSATQNAIWTILKGKVSDNSKNVSYDELADRIVEAAKNGTDKYLEREPEDSDVTLSVPESTQMIFNNKDNQWQAGPFSISEENSLIKKGEYTISLEEGSQLKPKILKEGKWTEINSVSVNEPFYLVSEQNIQQDTTASLIKTIPWVEQDGIRQFAPPDIKNSINDKYYQHMIGAIIHETPISKEITVQPGEPEKATGNDVEKGTGSDIEQGQTESGGSSSTPGGGSGNTGETGGSSEETGGNTSESEGGNTSGETSSSSEGNSGSSSEGGSGSTGETGGSSEETGGNTSDNTGESEGGNTSGETGTSTEGNTGSGSEGGSESTGETGGSSEETGGNTGDNTGESKGGNTSGETGSSSEGNTGSGSEGGSESTGETGGSSEETGGNTGDNTGESEGGNTSGETGSSSEGNTESGSSEETEGDTNEGTEDNTDNNASDTSEKNSNEKSDSSVSETSGEKTQSSSGGSSSGGSRGSSGGRSSGSSGYSGATGIHSVFGASKGNATETTAESIAETVPEVPQETIPETMTESSPESAANVDSSALSDPEGAVKGQHRDRLHNSTDVDGETAGASRSVQTGDHAHMILYLAVSLIALIGLFGWKRKAEKQG